jgi:hypothetical protein
MNKERKTIANCYILIGFIHTNTNIFPNMHVVINIMSFN